MTPAAFDAELLARVAAVPHAELLALVRSLERGRDAALLRLVTAPVSRILTPEEASEIARVPVRRIRSWARAGKPWARYVGRLLRVDEVSFREWARRAEVASDMRARSDSGSADVSKRTETVPNGRGPHLRRVRG